MTKKKNINLELNESDAAVSVARTLANLFPVAGPFLAEVFTVLIPNQQKDRVIGTLKLILDKVDNIEEKLADIENLDLFQDAMLQSMRALTPERREYISNLFKNSLTKKQILHDQNKKLFRILGELNDSEIILLKYFSMSLGRDIEHPFIKKHWELLKSIERELASSKTDPRSVAFIYNYINTLDRLGLVNMQTERIKNRKPTGPSELGRLLLEYIEVPEE